VPANLTPAYLAAEERFREASTQEEKLDALQEMLRTIPKHKGTEKMQADIKRRIARLRKAIEKGGGARRRPIYYVEKQGAGQVALVGPPNAGKSSLLRALTNAEPEVGDYPFTTALPQPGMMPFENVQVQLVDLPPLHPDMSPGWIRSLVGAADALVVVLSLGSDDLLQEAETTLSMLRDMNVLPRSSKDAGEPRRHGPRGALVVANKVDADGADVRLELLRDMGVSGLDLMVCSALTGEGIDELRGPVFRLLEKIRVYTRAPGKEPRLDAPFVLDRGTTVIEAAAVIHKDLAKDFNYARAWGKDTFDGQMVGRDHVLHDGDVLEIHT